MTAVSRATHTGTEPPSESPAASSARITTALVRWPSCSPWPKATAPAAMAWARRERLLTTFGGVYRAAQAGGPDQQVGARR